MSSSNACLKVTTPVIGERGDTLSGGQRQRIAEAGKHQKLLAGGGLYSQLYDIRFKKQEVEPVIEDFVSIVH